MSALYSSAKAEGVQSRACLGPADAAGRVPREGVEGARRRHLGGAGAAPPLHPLQGHGLGGRRPRRAHARGVARPRGAARHVAHAAGRHLHRGLREGLQQGRRRLHAVLRVGPARCQRAHDPARRLPAAQRPARGEHGRGGAARAHGPRLRAALPHERRRFRRRADRPGGRLPGLLVLAGRLPAHDRARRGGRGALRAPPGPAQRPRAARRRSTTRWPVGSSATSPRRSRTCP